MLPNGRQESKPGPRPTASPSYDPENEGAWDGQLPNPDLVDQLPPSDDKVLHSLPDLDNTVKTLFYWAMDLDIPHGPRLALLTILRHIDWGKGDHCTAGIKTLARESHFSTKTLKAHIRFLVAQNLISRFRHIGRTTEPTLPTLPTLISPKGKGGKRRLHRGGWMRISDAMTSDIRNFLNFPTPTTSRVSLPRIMDSLSAGVSPVIQGQLFPVSTASFSSTITLVRALWDLSSAIFKRYPWPSPFPFTRLQ